MIFSPLEVKSLESQLVVDPNSRGRISPQQKAAYDRYVLIGGIIQDHEDNVAQTLLDETVLDSSRYATILAASSALDIQIHRYSGEAYRERVSNFDRRRKAQHDSLLVDVRALNRRLFKQFGKEVPPGGIYTGPLDPLIGMRVEKVDDWDKALRSVIGEWSTHLTLGIYYHEKKDCRE